MSDSPSQPGLKLRGSLAVWGHTEPGAIRTRSPTVAKRKGRFLCSPGRRVSLGFGDDLAEPKTRLQGVRQKWGPWPNRLALYPLDGWSNAIESRLCRPYPTGT